MDKEPADVVDGINELLKLGVGDRYRLEHIKLAYVENKSVWESDKKYLAHLKEKYIDTKKAEPVDTEEVPVKGGPVAAATADYAQDAATMYCWSCGKKNLLKANFCMKCGALLFEVGAEEGAAAAAASAPASPPAQRRAARARRGAGARGGLGKKKILIGVAALAALLLVTGMVQGGLEITIGDAGEKPGAGEGNSTHSKCGSGTVFDNATNACVIQLT